MSERRYGDAGDLAGLDVSAPVRIHVIGVGGAGMRAIASVLAAMGHTVSGSDMKTSGGLDRLRAEGIRVDIGHDAALVEGVDLVTRSTAVPDTNVEVQAARTAGIPVASRAELLAAITRQRPTVSVAGTHGKTTTSSMLAVILDEASLSPSFIIGGDVNEIGSGAVWSDAPDSWFVVEADESDGTFLVLESSAAIVTSVEPDHLSYYGSADQLEEAFRTFASNVEGPLVLCADDAASRALAGGLGSRAVTYGTDDGADWRISGYAGHRSGAAFTLTSPDGDSYQLEVATPGLHNVRNATAAAVMALSMGADLDAVSSGLRRFGGVARRFQFRGEANGVTYVDDYAHLPAEVEAALEAAVCGGWDRVICVFQPHRYSRTGELWRSFERSFERADLVVVTDIYAAGERPEPGVTGRLVADAVAGTGATVAYLPHRDDLRVYLEACLVPGDLCLTLGAGDLTTLPDEMLTRST